MRLTLRTMLAYLDEILDPEDQKEIGKKIEESEFAADLVRRTRDVMQRLRLGAPALSGRGMGLDPNTVAEYLDNSLPAERVPEFERACLEADICLAEVAACHQILTLVLGQPAEVDTDTRQRMYRAMTAAFGQEEMAAAVAAEPPATEAAGLGGAADRTDGASDGPYKTRSRPEIPEYLRESSGAVFWRYAAAAVVVILLVSAAALFSVRRKAGPNGPDGEPDRIAQAHAGPEDTHNDRQQSQTDTVAEDGRSDGPSLDRAAPPEAAPPGTTAGGQDGQPRNDEAAGELPAPAPPAADGGAAQAPEVAGEHTDQGGPGAETEQPAATGPPAPPAPLPDQRPARGAETPPADAGATDDGSAPPGSEQTSGTATAIQSPPAPAAPPPAADLGIYSNTDVLLKFDAESSRWRRLPLRAPIVADERLLAFPSFRPQVTLTSGSGITLEMVGAAALVLQNDNAQGIPGIDLRYGRIILLNVGGVDNRLRIQLGDRQPQVQFGDIGATLAIELTRQHTPGANPEEAPAPVAVHAYATSGKLHWKAADEQTGTEMIAPGEWRLDAGRLVRVADASAPPAWIDSAVLNAIEMRASRSLEEELTLDRPVDVALVLQELVEGQRSGRRSEVRSLAARCSVHVGQFEPFVEALNDPEQTTWWPLLIKSLEKALAREPSVATAIRRAFVRQRGEPAGDELFRLLRGYSPEDLTDGADKQLVDYLQHDQLDFRVLALWNLIRITGLGQPTRLQDPKAGRQQLVRRWRQRLEEGQIVPKADRP